MVINDWDLLEDNIHVDIQTGNLGILLASSIGGAEVGPFAVHLWGLENILGIWKTTCMAFYPQHDIRRFFWKTLLNGIGNVPGETKLASTWILALPSSPVYMNSISGLKFSLT